jgi:hypothetical protein
MLPVRIGLASQSASVGKDDLAAVAAALDLQVNRDFAPVWGIAATVAMLPDADQVPPGVWPIFVKDELPPGMGGVHLTKHLQPFALVKAGETWSLAASHECLEMLADPAGTRLFASQGIGMENGAIVSLDTHFEYLVEVCDPCEAPDCAYLIDGVLVSDFYTPRFFDFAAAGGVRYSHTGKITAPRQVLPDGYLSWYEATEKQFFQLQNGPGGPQVRPLGLPKSGNLRRFVDLANKNGPRWELSHAGASVMGKRRSERALRLTSAAKAGALAYIGGQDVQLPG